MFITASSIAASISNRFPLDGDSTVDLQASADKAVETDKTFDIQAQALRSYTQPAGKFVNVKALEHHFVAGNFVSAGDPDKGLAPDVVEVTEADAATLIALGRARVATDDEIAAAQKGSKGK